MKYYGIQINMNEVTKLKYCGFAEGIKDVDTLDEAKDYAMEIYNDLKKLIWNADFAFYSFS